MRCAQCMRARCAQEAEGGGRTGKQAKGGGRDHAIVAVGWLLDALTWYRQAVSRPVAGPIVMWPVMVEAPLIVANLDDRTRLASIWLHVVENRR